MRGFFQMLKKKKEVSLNWMILWVIKAEFGFIYSLKKIYYLISNSDCMQLIPLIGFMAFAAMGATTASIYFLLTKSDVMWVARELLSSNCFVFVLSHQRFECVVASVLFSVWIRPPIQNHGREWIHPSPKRWKKIQPILFCWWTLLRLNLSWDENRSFPSASESCWVIEEAMLLNKYTQSSLLSRQIDINVDACILMSSSASVAFYRIMTKLWNGLEM